ncbi:MAG: metal ABC transporter permease [Candidatus Sumerlaeaceae bacterium]|jgi:manganese/iron transport system permease protein
MVLTWILAALCSGVSCGLLGVYLVGLEMPFLGIAMAHAALAGAVIGYLVGGPVWLWAGGAAWGTGLMLARLAYSSVRSDLGALSSIVFSTSMGVAFLGIGLAKGEMSSLLGLLWGNILFVRPAETALLLAVTVLLGVFLSVSGRLLDALIFARRSETYAFDPRPVFIVFMTLTSVIITLNLQLVGGLLMYALLANAAAAAFEIAEDMVAVRRYAALFGLLATLGGLTISWVLDLPIGACVVLISTACYAAAFWARRRDVWQKRRSI